jgi:predicted GIY-YIG superfamily endonuclease
VGSTPTLSAFASLKLGFGVTKSAMASESGLQYVVYVLGCKDGFYVGCTNNLKERIERHNKGCVPATRKRLPVKLISYFAFSNKYTAFNFEKYLKSGSGRAFLKKRLV